MLCFIGVLFRFLAVCHSPNTHPHISTSLGSACRPHTEIDEETESDPEEQRIPTAWWVIGLGASGLFCTALLTPMLELPIRDPLAAVGLALLVAVLAVRALGQTDLNPVSGVGKLSQVKTCTEFPAGRVCTHCSWPWQNW